MKNHTKYSNTIISTVFILMIIVLSTLLFSCRKFVEVPLPKDRLVNELVFNDDPSATAAILGIYSNMMQTNTLISSTATWYPGLNADELNYVGTSASSQQFLKNSILIDNSEVDAAWTQGYQFIYYANSAIEGLNKSSTVSEATKKQLLGEAKVIRALVYFYLTNLYDAVPLVTGTDYEKNAVLPRVAQTEIYDFAVQDLKEAKELLLPAYPTADRVRPNKWTASALLARIYLYQKQWDKAEKEATEVINSKVYSIAPVSDTFLKTSNETIWQLMPVAPSSNTLVSTRFIPSSNTSVPLFPLTNELANIFDANDLRKATWIGKSIASGITYYYAYKYKIRTTNATTTENYGVFRLAEQYLIRAEARARLNVDLKGGIDDVDVLRIRAGISKLPENLLQADLLAAVEKERRMELFAEWGHRWYDLKRTGRLDAVMSVFKPTSWKPTAALWPIPFSQIKANKQLVQNPGYTN
ncbi:RagB/SusD family nutrient uptake outer membrane protein [Pedobacter sp. MC2016-24]|uniref:RagB/SusD family nutrient uptake outer membrane protein n=1 Tax=Pedobacter sp. MC2016-24 TaxID=2780090 RepID=UPI001880DD7A|nr:RagB/SusD family nutrient uptake outer membrane protein [Pedobacter sp. MC2016-24]MBE9598671.1 RagB/SusD family nutrient uptake outer membrane protein [Pedobacter sp. MC2016-24]